MVFPEFPAKQGLFRRVYSASSPLGSSVLQSLRRDVQTAHMAWLARSYFKKSSAFIDRRFHPWLDHRATHRHDQ